MNKISRRSIRLSSEEIAVCKKCNTRKRIHARDMCYRCYTKDTMEGNCRKCGKRAALKKELCDRCYRKERYTGPCKACSKMAVLKSGLCGSCYNRKYHTGECTICGETKVLSGNKCPACWIKANKRGECAQCGKSTILSGDLCSACYKKKNYTGECKKCQQTGVPLTEGLCKTCYNYESRAGLCSSCGDYGVLTEGLCDGCYKHKAELGECEGCERQAVLNEDNLCEPCQDSVNHIGICFICGVERPLVNNKVCTRCLEEHNTGIQHQMRASIGHVLERLLGKENFNKFGEEIMFENSDKPFSADWAVKDLRGKWCPVQYFNSSQEWQKEYGKIDQFADFYKNYLQPHNYLMVTFQHNTLEKIRDLLKQRGFLSNTGLPYGKEITVDPKLYKHKEDGKNIKDEKSL